MHHRSPENSDSSLPGNDDQRRRRAVHKLRLDDLSGLTPAQLTTMVGSGDIELIVRRDQLAAADWSRRVGRLFEMLAGSIGAAPAHVNRTVIVNLLAESSAADGQP